MIFTVSTLGDTTNQLQGKWGAVLCVVALQTLANSTLCSIGQVFQLPKLNFYPNILDVSYEKKSAVKQMGW